MRPSASVIHTRSEPFSTRARKRLSLARSESGVWSVIRAAPSAPGLLGSQLVVEGLGIDPQSSRRLAPVALEALEDGLDVGALHLVEAQVGPPGGGRGRAGTRESQVGRKDGLPVRKQ